MKEVDLYVTMYKKMLKIRAFEEKAIELYYSGQIPGFIHSYVGEEAVAVGVCSALQDGDFVTSTHRGHGHLIAMGVDLPPMMAELLGKGAGCCKGKGGSMHVVDFRRGVIGANGIVGGSIPIATGLGLAAKMLGSEKVVACFFGDGASNHGSFHEALNLASIWDLPVVFVCENNLYAQGTSQSYHQRVKDISKRAESYGMVGASIDGQDVLRVYEEAKRAVDRARLGDGPTLIECKTYRFEGHYVGERLPYRSLEEIEQWHERCPIKIHRQFLLMSGLISETDDNAIRQAIGAEVESAVAYALQSALPEEGEAFTNVC